MWRNVFQTDVIMIGLYLGNTCHLRVLKVCELLCFDQTYGHNPCCRDPLTPSTKTTTLVEFRTRFTTVVQVAISMQFVSKQYCKKKYWDMPLCTRYCFPTGHCWLCTSMLARQDMIDMWTIQKMTLSRRKSHLGWMIAAAGHQWITSIYQGVEGRKR